MGASTQKPVYAFIDSQNLNLGVKEQGWRLDFAKFRIFLKDKYGVEKAFLFIGHIAGHEDLYSSLGLDGYTLIFKPVVVIMHGGIRQVKGNVDAELVLHTMIEYPNYNKAIIVSGDGDFHCLVEYLSEKGKLLKVIAPNSKYSSLLRAFSEYIVTIGQFKNKVSNEK